MLQKACGKLKFLSNNCSAKKVNSPSYCTGNMLQKACGKFEFLPNNCSAKKTYFSTDIEQTFFSKIDCGSGKSAKMYTNCRQFFTVSVT
jgi:hypothetical protein